MFDFSLNKDILWSTTGAANGRLVIDNVYLYATTIQLNDKGLNLYLKSFQSPYEIPYIREYIERSNSSSVTNSMIQLSNGVLNPTHVIICLLNNENLTSQEKNTYHSDLFSIGGNAQISNCRIVINDKIRTSIFELRPKTEPLRCYRMLTSYLSTELSNQILSPSIIYDEFINRYGYLIFNVEGLSDGPLNSLTRLRFKYTLDVNPTGSYSFYYIIRSKDNLSVNVLNSKVMIES